MDGQISDGKGNLFHPNKTQARLAKAGWRVYKMKVQGMIKIIRWLDPCEGQDYDQGTAFQILKDRENFIRNCEKNKQDTSS